jgi:Flp pilus assembly pilin Flp
MLVRLRRAVRRGLKDTSGAMSIEKILIIALIALPILIALVLFKNDIKGWFNTQKTDLKSGQTADPGNGQ